ncbi:TPA: hypothetical protein DEP96_00720 [Candidatus Uhrbacteria bacterium]|nr:hypothetical protein [Candidatus Uhrbacteria bacterium]
MYKNNTMDIIYIDEAIKEFADSFTQPTEAKIIRGFALLRDYNHRVRMPNARKITSRIYELRILGLLQVRLFYTFHKDRIFILHGFIKKTQELPRNELAMAKRKLSLLD